MQTTPETLTVPNTDCLHCALSLCVLEWFNARTEGPKFVPYQTAPNVDPNVVIEAVGEIMGELVSQISDPKQRSAAVVKLGLIIAARENRGARGDGVPASTMH